MYPLIQLCAYFTCVNCSTSTCKGTCQTTVYYFFSVMLVLQAARNCGVTKMNVVKVGDFSLTRHVVDDEYTASEGTTFAIKGAAPEVISHFRFSSKSDVWSYGEHMYFCVCTHAYIHTYTHTYIHLHIHTHVHTYIHTYIHTHIHIIYSAYSLTHIHTYTTYICG